MEADGAPSSVEQFSQMKSSDRYLSQVQDLFCQRLGAHNTLYPKLELGVNLLPSGFIFRTRPKGSLAQ